jgi:glycosyltransferase involved in cell wall biosynthesis
MKIALVLAKFERGGLFNANYGIAQELASRGHEVTIFAATRNSAFMVPPATQVSVRELDANSTKSSIGLLRRHLFDGSFDVAFVSQMFLGSIALLARPKRSGTALVLVEHSSLEYWKKSAKSKDRLAYRLAKWTWTKADLIGAVSKTTALNIERSFNRAPRVRYLPNPVLRGDEPIFSLETSTGRSRSGIIYVGRLSPEKHVPDIISAFSLIQDRVNDHLRIVGDGPEMNRCRDLVTRLGLESRVEFMGYVDVPSAVMTQSRLLVLASSHEGLPTVLIEGLANGCEIASTDCPTGPKEILDGGRFGRLVAVGDVRALADAMFGQARPESELKEVARHLRQFLATASGEAYESVGLEAVSRRKLRGEK